MKSPLLQALTRPRSVAVIGASDNLAKLTSRPQSFLKQHRFPGQFYPVNPARETVLGIKAWGSVAAIPAEVDHAYILLDAAAALTSFEDCAAAGVRVVSMLADGFAEAGAEGKVLQDRLSRLAQDAGILLIGPNSTGVVHVPGGFVCTTNAAFREAPLLVGRTAVLSQSGSMIGAILSRGAAMDMGFSTLVSVGNEAAAGVGRIGQILLDDPETDSFILFLETLREADQVAAFARRAAAQGKPLVAYVVGRSEEGQALSVSHTGALTGGRAALSAWLASVGIAEVENFETLLAAPTSLIRAGGLAGRPRTATVLSTTGGGGAMVLDQISLRKVPIAGCSLEARRLLEADYISLGHGKLVDVTLAGAKYETMRRVIDTLIHDPETGLLVIAIGSSARFNPELSVKPIVDAVQQARPGAAPVVAIPLPDAPESLRMLQQASIVAFRSVEICAEVVALLMGDRMPVPEVATHLSNETRSLLRGLSGTLEETAAGAVFETLGIARPRSLVLGPDDPVYEDNGLGWPVVAKLVSPDLPHKSEAGAVTVGIRSLAELQTAIERMSAAAEAHRPGYRRRGILVQEMKSGVGEVLLGLTRDPLVGPVLTVATGGVMTEIYKDAAVRPAPVSRQTAEQMIDEVRGLAVLRGFRGRPRGDLDALAEAIAAFSQIALCDEVTEAEINPLLVQEHGVVLLDALICLRSAELS
ncbi:acetate--CoA ligase family protein [Hoeflea alexandrii]|uniref:acetate--CoA ligase family protein n=1 Tax=Hoeflea alexandrii TaxID=288436 RepID=UPI0022AF8EFC|nr:acetate--CoA ligase family protein [Hoeflea alexandrii]MCZ4292230.1 acetate--CoA ligase family protein [Hoeflea alexandrii]